MIFRVAFSREGASAIFARVSSTAVAPSERERASVRRPPAVAGASACEARCFKDVRRMMPGRRSRRRVAQAAVKEKLADFSVVRERAGSAFTCCETRSFKRYRSRGRAGAPVVASRRRSRRRAVKRGYHAAEQVAGRRCAFARFGRGERGASRVLPFCGKRLRECGGGGFAGMGEPANREKENAPGRGGEGLWPVPFFYGNEPETRRP